MNIKEGCEIMLFNLSCLEVQITLYIQKLFYVMTEFYIPTDELLYKSKGLL